MWFFSTWVVFGLIWRCVHYILIDWLLQVPLYLVAQALGSILASGTLSLLFDVDEKSYFGTVPVGPHIRSLVMEILTSFLLMFVVSAVATDNRAVSIYYVLIFCISLGFNTDVIIIWSSISALIIGEKC